MDVFDRLITNFNLFAFKRAGIPITGPQLEQLVESLDIDGDGNLGFG